MIAAKFSYFTYTPLSTANASTLPRSTQIIELLDLPTDGYFFFTHSHEEPGVSSKFKHFQVFVSTMSPVVLSVVRNWAL